MRQNFFSNKDNISTIGQNQWMFDCHLLKQLYLHKKIYSRLNNEVIWSYEAVRKQASGWQRNIANAHNRSQALYRTIYARWRTINTANHWDSFAGCVDVITSIEPVMAHRLYSGLWSAIHYRPIYHCRVHPWVLLIVLCVINVSNLFWISVNWLFLVWKVMRTLEWS